MGWLSVADYTFHPPPFSLTLHARLCYQPVWQDLACPCSRSICRDRVTLFWTFHESMDLISESQ